LEYLRIKPGVETPGYFHSSLCDDQTSMAESVRPILAMPGGLFSLKEKNLVRSAFVPTCAAN
jgi:hypothetical protein